jgi:hypothetical protein
MTKPLMIISFPKSGSDFFLSCILQSHNDLSYHREWFNPICTEPDAANRLRDAGFGSEDDPDLVFQPCRSLPAYPFDLAKENFMCCKLPALQSHFHLVALRRSAEHTFPTPNPEYMLPLYRSFLSVQTWDFLQHDLAQDLTRIQRQLCALQLSEDQLCCYCVYQICWHIQNYFCNKLGIRIIEYDSCMSLPNPELSIYLQYCFQEYPMIDCGKLAECIVQERNPTFLKRSSVFQIPNDIVNIFKI